MKKLLSFLVLTVAICGFTIGCGEGDSAPADSGTPETSAPAGDDAAAPADDAAAPADTPPAE